MCYVYVVFFLNGDRMRCVVFFGCDPTLSVSQNSHGHVALLCLRHPHLCVVFCIFFFPLPVITFCVWLVFWTVTTQNSGLLLGGVGCGSLFFFGFFLWSKMIQNAGALLRVARRCFLYVNFFFCDVDCLVSGEYIAGPLLREVGG